MTTQQPQILDRCPECELDYYGDHCARCPLCPLRVKLEEAQTDLRLSEPFRVSEHFNSVEIQDDLNKMATRGWLRESIHVGHYQDRDGGWPVYLVVLTRQDYDVECHRQAALGELNANAAYLVRRAEIECETERVTAERGEGS